METEKFFGKKVLYTAKIIFATFENDFEHESGILWSKWITCRDDKSSFD
jgi:hypothetical protein